MDLPFNGVGLTKNKKHSVSYPPSPTASEVNTGCLTCCCGNKTGGKNSQQVGFYCLTSSAKAHIKGLRLQQAVRSIVNHFSSRIGKLTGKLSIKELNLEFRLLPPSSPWREM